jgi:hypothetical protein
MLGIENRICCRLRNQRRSRQREIGPRRKRDCGSRKRQPAVAQFQQQGKRESSTGRFTDDNDPP